MIKGSKEHSATAEALRFWLRETGVRQADLAEKIGLEQGTISNMVRGARGIKADYLEKMCEAFGISLAEFFACKSGALPELVFIPLVKAVPRAGTGGLETDGDTKCMYAFHSSFIRRRSGTPESMVLFKIEGDSMEPTLYSGDMIMINRKLTEVRSGGIHLIRFEGELMIKRLERRPGGELLIRSDNPSYQNLAVNPGHEHIDMEIFGRMIWLAREF